MQDEDLDPDTREAYDRIFEATEETSDRYIRDWRYICGITDSILDIWKQFPELRLGQLLDNAISKYGPKGMGRSGGPDMFTITDEELVAALKKMQEELHK